MIIDNRTKALYQIRRSSSFDSSSKIVKANGTIMVYIKNGCYFYDDDGIINAKLYTYDAIA